MKNKGRKGGAEEGKEERREVEVIYRRDADKKEENEKQ